MMKNENKKMFISTVENALLLYSRENIAQLEYWVCNGDEYVTIKYTTGFERTINITGDSCLGIMKDVVRGLE